MYIGKASNFRLERESEYGTPEQNAAVKEIVEAIRKEGDDALLRYTAAFDKVMLTPEQLRVTDEEIQGAYTRVAPEFLTALRQAAANIKAFHEKQKRGTWIDVAPDGTMLGMVLRPLKRVGLYVPGGKAAYPSSV